MPYSSTDSYKPPIHVSDVNILVRKIDTLSKKEMKIIKTQTLWWKTTTRKAKKVYESIK